MPNQSLPAPLPPAPTSARELAPPLAAALGETEARPLNEIAWVIRALSLPVAEALVQEALRIHQGEGMPTRDGRSLRTAGGIFFVLARDRATPAQRRLLRSPRPVPEPVELKTLLPVLATLPAGVVASACARVIGRPEQAVRKGADRGFCFTVRDTRSPSLPAGLPRVEPDQQQVLVYVTERQWRQLLLRLNALTASPGWLSVEEALRALPEDQLLIEGVPTRSEAFPRGVTVLATNVTSLAVEARRHPLADISPLAPAGQGAS